jgi:prepilin-type N-terminal cleavage/methylation domain-containing protein
MRQRRRIEGGFTLVELLISITLLSVVMGAITGTVLSMQRGYIRQREVARTEDALRVAEMTITRILQAAGANPLNIPAGAAAPGVPRIDPLTAPFDTIRVVSDYNPVDGDAADLLEDMEVWVTGDTLYVRWQFGGAATPVAFPVRSLLFQYDSAGTVLPTPARITNNATRVRVTLTAPRHSRTNALARRDTWVYLRNRR